MITLLNLTGGRKRSKSETEQPEESKKTKEAAFNSGLIICVLLFGLFFYVFIFLFFTTPSHLSVGEGTVSEIDHTSLIEGLAPRWKTKRGKKPPHRHHRDFEVNKGELVVVQAQNKMDQELGDVLEKPKSFRHRKGKIPMQKRI